MAVLRRAWIPVALLALASSLAPAQQQSAPKKQLDVGLREAQLTDQEREDLSRALEKHIYKAEKEIIDKAIGEHPDSRELQILLGRVAYLENTPKDSADALLRADKISPLSEDDRLALALSLGFSNRIPQGRTEFLKLMKESPKNAQYPFLLGRLDVNEKHMEDAVKDFGRAVELDPGLMQAWEKLGLAQESLGLTDEARKTYETAATRNRANKVHWEWSPLDLGVVLLGADELDQAEKLFQESLGYNPHFGWGHYYMGRLYEKQGKDTESTNEYKQAVIYDPQLRQAWLALGRQFTRAGNKAQADKALAIFKKLEGDNSARQGHQN